MGYRPQDQHVPNWARSLAGIWRMKADLRFYCPRCHLLFDTDLRFMIRALGADWSPMNRYPRCKVSGCRKPGLFVVAEHEYDLGLPLTHAFPFRDWKRTWRLKDISTAPEVLRPRDLQERAAREAAMSHYLSTHASVVPAVADEAMRGDPDAIEAGEPV